MTTLWCLFFGAFAAYCCRRALKHGAARTAEFAAMQQAAMRSLGEEMKRGGETLRQAEAAMRQLEAATDIKQILAGKKHHDDCRYCCRCHKNVFTKSHRHTKRSCLVCGCEDLLPQRPPPPAPPPSKRVRIDCGNGVSRLIELPEE